MDLNKDNFDKEVLQSQNPVLVDFWAEWCAPCRVQCPIVEVVGEEAKDFKVAKLNVDENQEIASKYSIRSIPTLMIFKGGEPVEQMVGLRQKEEILEKLVKYK